MNVCTRLNFEKEKKRLPTFKESLQHRWTLFAGISGNRNDISLKGVSVKPQATTGYARFGISNSGSR